MALTDDSEIKLMGNMGCYLDENNIISFQTGMSLSVADIPDFAPDNIVWRQPDVQWLNVCGYNVCARGANNRLCEEIEQDIKRNRLLPRLINKQVNMLYGKGPAIYIEGKEGNKPVRNWTGQPDIQQWLDSWQDNGLEMSYKDYALALIKRYYFFRDYFTKWRMSSGRIIGRVPVAGLELMENKHCRLATTKRDVVTSLVQYNDFRYIATGNWNYGAAQFKIYPKFDLREVGNYRFAAISHHRESSVGDFYGCNETHEGTKPWIKGANESPEYINSFLKNSLAAKVHVVIPAAWIEAKRKQISAICQENVLRKKDNKELFTYNGIDVGTKFSESSLIKYMNLELRRLSKYLSGKDNQGKAYATTSFRTGANEEERWRIETVDLKYKEYISSLIEYDKRADEVLLAAVGMDSSISSVSKDGVISKSGADVYYNYLIYLLTLTPDDEKCSEAFNMAIRVNWPELYAQGYRIGDYRETPSRQEEVSPDNRLNKQEV